MTNKLEWDLAPSGSIDYEVLLQDPMKTLVNQIGLEFEEEVGASRKLFSEAKPFVAVGDDEQHVIDIGIEIMLACKSSKLEELAAQRSSGEYTEIKLVHPHELDLNQLNKVSVKLLEAKHLI